ncbi:heparan-alpha-glucosaminide N-acetyltransferase domain-containing protein, partial [Petrachloros mirabilis]
MASLDFGRRPPTLSKEVTQAVPARLAALDIFRGLCIFWMVLVNNPGDPAHVFTPIRHVEWHGWTLADLVAPGFLWIVGVAVPLAIGKYLDAGLPRGRLQLRILRRSVTLYALEVLIIVILAPHCSACSPVWTDIPVLGILQRIAICYLVAASVFLWSGMRGVVVATLACLGIYIGVLYALTSFYNLADPFARQDNFDIYLHAIVLGPNVNSGQDLVTALTGIVTTLSGVIVGWHLRTNRHLAVRESLIILLISAVSIALGYVLDAWIPINRYLWTPSFVLLTSGISMALFTVLNRL